MIQVIHQGSIF